MNKRIIPALEKLKLDIAELLPLAQAIKPKAVLLPRAPFLHTQMAEYFNDGEIRDIAFQMTIDYENLQGLTKSERALSLVLEANRTERIQELVKICQGMRPLVQWASL